jgi:hypothetical protein
LREGLPQQVVADLNAESADYVIVPDNAEESAASPTLETLCRLLAESGAPLTREEILKLWPAQTPPSTNSLWRALTRGCEMGRLVRSGAGVKLEPFRYEVV